MFFVVELLSEDATKNSTDTELAEWFNDNFAGFWSIYFPWATAVSYLFFFGIGGYLHVRLFNNISKKVSNFEFFVKSQYF